MERTLKQNLFFPLPQAQIHFEVIYRPPTSDVQSGWPVVSTKQFLSPSPSSSHFSPTP